MLPQEARFEHFGDFLQSEPILLVFPAVAHDFCVFPRGARCSGTAAENGEKCVPFGKVTFYNEPFGKTEKRHVTVGKMSSRAHKVRPGRL